MDFWPLYSCYAKKSERSFQSEISSPGKFRVPAKRPPARDGLLQAKGGHQGNRLRVRAEKSPLLYLFDKLYGLQAALYVVIEISAKQSFEFPAHIGRDLHHGGPLE